MKKLLFLSTLLLSLAETAFSQVSNDNEDGVMKISVNHSNNTYIAGQVLVKFKSPIDIKVNRSRKLSIVNNSQLNDMLIRYGVDEIEQILPKENTKCQLYKSRAYSGETIEEKDLSQLYCIRLSKEYTEETAHLIDELNATDEVEFAEPNYLLYTLDNETISGLDWSSNPSATNQWYLEAYGVKKLWDKPIISKTRPVIAILDTGVDITHPDLVDNLWMNAGEYMGSNDYDNDRNGFKNDIHGWDFVNNTPNIRDNNMHGTHVAGIASASNNAIGIVGANPRALIMPVTVMQSDGSGDVATIIKGINYAIANGATILNMSFGTYANSSALRQALENAYQKAVLVAAAGNDRRCVYTSHTNQHGASPCFPAAYSFVLGVQATTYGGDLAAFSNYDDDGALFSCESTANDPNGFNYELKAPGTNILSTIPGGRYKELNGTSMAAPLVAGSISALQMVKQYESQETLWADLLHSNNIAGAFDITVRPAELDIIGIEVKNRTEQTEFDQSENQYAKFYEVNVGETVNLYPIIRSSFGKASNIMIKLTSSSSEINILTQETNFGYKLDAFGKMVSQNPLTFRVPDNMPNGSEIAVTVTATCNESDQPSFATFRMKVNNMYTLKGLLIEDMTLTPEHIYYVSSNFGINEGVTLTIEPGTHIEFAKFTGLYSYGKLVAHGTPQDPIFFAPHNSDETWTGIFASDTISYCKIEGFSEFKSSWERSMSEITTPFKDCVLCPVQNSYNTTYAHIRGKRNVVAGLVGIAPLYINSEMTNYVNNEFTMPYYNLKNSNYFNNYQKASNNKYYAITTNYSSGILTMNNPSYLGTAREDIIRPYISELGNSAESSNTATLDLSNMLTEPVRDAHGVVWKILVNGIDPQDEYESLPALGIGQPHKFEVYFNRPMNKEIAPIISFGVTSPYNQQSVAENASWNSDGTVYTAYKTITGTTKSDGINRIYVRGAEDNEFFPCPYEAIRFNIIVQAAGSLATGFTANAGLGCVNLSWNNENNDFEDAMGFNIYRYSETSDGLTDTIRVNQEILDISTNSYSDYSVKPGNVYYYYYKVLSTDLQEYDVSNVVTATPQTATRGDANGSGEVDVADIITIANYITGMNPDRFVFDAADINRDQIIDLFDVVGIIRGIQDPSLLSSASAYDATATYTIEDGILYVDSPVALAGVQVQLWLDGRSIREDVHCAEGLNGFEQASAWLSEEDYLCLAYSLSGKSLSPGKHALLHIGESQIGSLRLSDMSGRNVKAVGSESTSVSRLSHEAMNANGTYDLQGRKLFSSGEFSKLRRGVYIINGRKIVK